MCIHIIENIMKITANLWQRVKSKSESSHEIFYKGRSLSEDNWKDSGSSPRVYAGCLDLGHWIFLV